MKQFLLDLLQSKSSKSSSRFINLLGFVFMTIWITNEVYTNGLNYEILAVYATYCAGGYLGSKYLSKENTNNESING